MADWRMLEGYKYPYRINERGRLERLVDDIRWMQVTLIETREGRFNYYMIRKDGIRVCRSLKSLMRTAFGPDNLIARKSNTIAVEKIDKKGRVIETYCSLNDAASANSVSANAIRYQCEGRLKDPLKRRTFGFRYKEDAP